MIKVGIVGGTGYTGVELLRLLAQHPEAEIVAITSRGDAGTAVSSMFPSLRGRLSLKFQDPASANLKACDVVFFATPNGVAMQQAPALLDAGVRVIDLAADFRRAFAHAPMTLPIARPTAIHWNDMPFISSVATMAISS